MNRLPLRCMASQIDAEALHAVEQQAQLFIENEEGRLFAALDRRDEEQRWRGGICRCPPAPGSACSIRVSMPLPSKLVQFGDAARQRAPLVARPMLRGHQPRKHVQPAGGDGDVMIAAAKFYAAIFDDARTTPLCAISRRKLLEPQHAVRHAVNGLVAEVRRHVVEQQHAWRRNLRNNA